MLNEEKSTSRSQQRLMGMVYAYEKGDLKLDSLPQSLADKIKGIADGTKRKTGDKRRKTKGISKKSAKDFASTKHKGLPEKVKENINIIKYCNFVTETKDNESEILDDLKSNFNSWKSNSDNAEDTETLSNNLLKRHPEMEYDEIYNISKQWTGYIGEEDEDYPETNIIDEIAVDEPGDGKGEIIIDEATGGVTSNESVLSFDFYLTEKKKKVKKDEVEDEADEDDEEKGDIAEDLKGDEKDEDDNKISESVMNFDIFINKNN